MAWSKILKSTYNYCERENIFGFISGAASKAILKSEAMENPIRVRICRSLAKKFEMKLLNIPDLQMEKLGDVPWKVHERSSPWQITRNESFDQKPRRTSGKLPASACRTKAPYNPPLPSCANPPLRIPQIGPLPASVPNHSPAKVRSANTKLPAAHNVWKCRDFAGNKARVSGCQST